MSRLRTFSNHSMPIITKLLLFSKYMGFLSALRALRSFYYYGLVVGELKDADKAIKRAFSSSDSAEKIGRFFENCNIPSLNGIKFEVIQNDLAAISKLKFASKGWDAVYRNIKNKVDPNGKLLHVDATMLIGRNISWLMDRFSNNDRNPFQDVMLLWDGDLSRPRQFISVKCLEGTAFPEDKFLEKATKNVNLSMLEQSCFFQDNTHYKESTPTSTESLGGSIEDIVICHNNSPSMLKLRGSGSHDLDYNDYIKGSNETNMGSSCESLPSHNFSQDSQEGKSLSSSSFHLLNLDGSMFNARISHSLSDSEPGEDLGLSQEQEPLLPNRQSIALF